ncbi:MAG: Uma2 family endonuclease [Cyanobacteria bacterium J069]|nr:MAG: Uma2 family endonuclease [Cyanobacteria bacterium J069]
MTQTQRNSQSDPYGNRPTSTKLPPLETGDHLSRAEFERRYEAMPYLKKAELIEGVVYVPAALRFKSHAKPHGWLITWLGTYEMATPGVEMGDNPTVRLDLDNDPQPDIVLLIDPAAGGQSRISEDDYIEGAPELIVEIAASSASIDLHTKKQVYRRNGVQEYVVWQSLDNKLDWFWLNEGEYVALSPDADGMIRSRMFPGFWLDVVALCAGNMTQVMQRLQVGIQSPAHAEFVQQLAARRGANP